MWGTIMNFSYIVRTSSGDSCFGLSNEEVQNFWSSRVHFADLSILLPNGEVFDIKKVQIGTNNPTVYYRNDIDDRLHKIVNGGVYFDFDFRELFIVCFDEIFQDYTVDMIDNSNKYFLNRIRIYRNDTLIFDHVHNGRISIKILEYGYVINFESYNTSKCFYINSSNPETMIEYNREDLFGNNGYETTIDDLLYKNKTIEKQFVNFYFTIENDQNSKLVIDYAISKKLPIFKIENEFYFDQTRNILIKVPLYDSKIIFFLYYVKVKSKLKGISVFGRDLSELYSDYEFDFMDTNKSNIRQLLADKYGVSIFKSRELMAAKYGNENIYKIYDCEKDEFKNVSGGYSPWNSIYFLLLTYRYGCKERDSFHSSTSYKNLVDYYKSEKSKLLENIEKSNNSEKELYRLIKLVFPNAIYQYRDIWLSKQSIDIYVPDIKIGIEFQGKQHYERSTYLDIYLDRFEYRVNRDKNKKSLCEAQGGLLLYWYSDQDINALELIKVLKQNGICEFEIEPTEVSLEMRYANVPLSNGYSLIFDI